MADTKLSNDANYLISLIYKYYLELKDNGISKYKAKFLGSSEDIQHDIVPEWSVDDTDDTCRELHKATLLDVDFGDNICYRVSLTDNGIVYMENKFHNKIDKLVDYIDKLKPF